MQERIKNIKYFALLGLRICVAYNLAAYGYSKLTGGMFDNSYAGMLTTPLNEVDNFHLTWYWFHKNPAFSVFIGIMQIISACLILFNRTKFLGAILALPVLIGTFFIDAVVVKSTSLSLRLIFYILVCLSIIYSYRVHLYNIFNDYRHRMPAGKISTWSFVYLFGGIVLAFAIELLVVLLANIGNLIFAKG